MQHTLVETIDYTNTKLLVQTDKIEEGSVSWRSPSNLAIIKYWGKHGRQLPRNPSISFTLDRAYTETSLYYRPRSGNWDENILLTFYFEDHPNDAFGAKVKKYLESLTPYFPFLKQLELVIRSRNSFPHSSGIASSASSMSALALCLCSLEHQFFGTLPDTSAFRRKASYLARLGSGSAARSVFPLMSIWGAHRTVKETSDLFGIPFGDELHEIFKTYRDDILIISQGSKAVSSRAGHALMEQHIYADNRYQQANRRFQQVLEVLKQGDVERFGQIAEAEALTLHALMMTSNPPYILLKPNTLAAIERIRDFREMKNVPLYFSLDAGPNLHLLYPESESKQVQPFIRDALLPFCEHRQWIEDRVGEGPIEL